MNNSHFIVEDHHVYRGSDADQCIREVSDQQFLSEHDRIARATRDSNEAGHPILADRSFVEGWLHNSFTPIYERSVRKEHKPYGMNCCIVNFCRIRKGFYAF